VLNGEPAPLPKTGAQSHSSIFGSFLLRPNGLMHQDVTRYGGRPQPRRRCDRWGPSPSPKRGRSPQFSDHVYCGQTAAWIKMALGVDVGPGPGHIVLDGDPALFPKKGAEAPQFSVHFYCGQTAGCTKVPLGMEVGLSQDNFVLDGDPARSPERGQSRQFSAHVYCSQTT